jgi:tryptophan-rich sensory protein
VFYFLWRLGFDEPGVKIAMVVFFIHLGLNILWSVLFFGMRSPLLGFIEIIVLWIFIVATLWLFWKVSRWAGILLIPYLLWVSFASVLNYYLWVLNM